MANSNNEKNEKKSLAMLFQQQSSITARLIAEVELLHEIVKELAKHLSVSEEKWRQIVDRAYSNLEKRKEEIVRTYFDAKNNK
jgi:predicted nucleic acid-binding protein